MSVIVIVKVVGDTDAFKSAVTERADEFRALRDQVRAAGAIHHQYAIKDGEGYIIDEWESADAFRELFNRPEMQTFMYSIGVQAGSTPEITIAESVDSPDRI